MQKKRGKTGRIYVVGVGPGDVSMMTEQAARALDESDVIAGYKTYIDLIKDDHSGKEYFSNGMKEEIARCEKCVEYAREGKVVSLVCSGDAGVYGMASPLLEVAEREGFDNIEIIPGVTAALSGAAILGAPLSSDFCVISLSDYLTPWDVIEKRLICAAEGDLCMVIYNPSSHMRNDHLKKACGILAKRLADDTACGWVKNIGREGCEKKVCTLGELGDEKVDMFTTVFIGNSQTRITGDRLVTPRGYRL